MFRWIFTSLMAPANGDGGNGGNGGDGNGNGGSGNGDGSGDDGDAGKTILDTAGAGGDGDAGAACLGDPRTGSHAGPAPQPVVALADHPVGGRPRRRAGAAGLLLGAGHP